MESNFSNSVDRLRNSLHREDTTDEISGADYFDCRQYDPERVIPTISPITPSDYIFRALGPKADENPAVMNASSAAAESGINGADAAGEAAANIALPVPESVQIQLLAKSVSAEIDVSHRERTEQIRTREDLLRAQNRADVKALRDMKRTKLDLNSDGEIVIGVELFGVDKESKPAFRIGSGLARYFCHDEDAEVLFVPVIFADGKTNDLYLDLQSIDKHYVNYKFDRAGIRFGFGKTKEQEIRSLFLDRLMKAAPLIELPFNHGFWKEDGEWHYAMQSDTTWTEVTQYV